MEKIEPSFGNKGKLVLVTAMTSNKTGIGKTTVSIGLADALNMLGHKTILALREPSMGPVFGIKGGATGGGASRLESSDQINLHFTGDFHAIAQANNLLASIIDNHIFQGNTLDIDTANIFFKRCLDINDRSLRQIEYEIGGQKIKTGFNITAASEVMAIVSLSKNIEDLKERLGDILVALNHKGEPVFARDLHAEEAMTILLKNVLYPNLVRTLGGSKALVHLGPFANIAHGCNSIIATQTALSLGDYCVTEAGFGSELGAEKFLNIKSRLLEKKPSVVVLVVAIKVTKEHGNGSLVAGFENIKKHIKNIKYGFGLNMVVAINQHIDDSAEDLDTLSELCINEGVDVCQVQAFTQGGIGCLQLAEKVIEVSNKKCDFKYTYDIQDTIKVKIEKIVKNVYGAREIKYSERANEKIKLAERLGMNNFFINIAKTQFSFSDDKSLLGAPKDFIFNITDLEIRSGAKMLVPIAGNMLLMPGLAKDSNYLNMKISKKGIIEGLE